MPRSSSFSQLKTAGFFRSTHRFSRVHAAATSALVDAVERRISLRAELAFRAGRLGIPYACGWSCALQFARTRCFSDVHHVLLHPVSGEKTVTDPDSGSFAADAGTRTCKALQSQAREQHLEQCSMAGVERSENSADCRATSPAPNVTMTR